MLKIHGSTEPEIISDYFDRRGWPGEARTHAEVVEVYRPRIGWRRFSPRKNVSDELLEVFAAEGITKVTLRSRYAGSRVISADFRIEEVT